MYQRCDCQSINALLHVLACNIMPIYVGTGVSCAMLCLTLSDDVLFVRLCLMLLNFNIWTTASAAGFVSAICFLMLGPSRILLTRSSRSEETDSSWHLSRNPLKGLASLNLWRCTILQHVLDGPHGCHSPVNRL